MVHKLKINSRTTKNTLPCQNAHITPGYGECEHHLQSHTHTHTYIHTHTHTHTHTYHLYSSNTRRRHVKCNFKKKQRKATLFTPTSNYILYVFHFLCFTVYIRFKLLLLLLLLLLFPFESQIRH
jgi:hypothetical protein